MKNGFFSRLINSLSIQEDNGLSGRKLSALWYMVMLLSPMVWMYTFKKITITTWPPAVTFEGNPMAEITTMVGILCLAIFFLLGLVDFKDLIKFRWGAKNNEPEPEKKVEEPAKPENL